MPETFYFKSNAKNVNKLLKYEQKHSATTLTHHCANFAIHPHRFCLMQICFYIFAVVFSVFGSLPSAFSPLLGLYNDVCNNRHSNSSSICIIIDLNFAHLLDSISFLLKYHYCKYIFIYVYVFTFYPFWIIREHNH